jgi:hypothetical protein
MEACAIMAPPKFIPDADFTPDAPATGGFVPDNQFVSDEQRYGGTQGAIRTGLRNALSGATLGLSDVALTKSGLVNPEQARLENETNPIAAGVGKTLGGAGALVGSGGAAAPLEAAGLPSLEAGVAGGALEGAALTAGNQVSDRALGNPELTAQKALAEIGMGTAFGGGLGVLGETVVPAITNKLSEGLQSLKEALEGPNTPAATRSMVKTLQGVFDSSKEAASDLYEKAAPANIKAGLESAQVPLEEARAASGHIIEQIQEQAPNLSSPSSVRALQDKLGGLQDAIEEAKSPYAAHKALSDFATDIDKGNVIKFGPVKSAAEMGDQEILHGLRSEVRDTLKDPSIWGQEAATHYAETSDAYASYANARKNFQQLFMRKLADGDRVVDPSKIQTFFNNTGKPTQDLRHQALQEFIQQSQALADKSQNYAGFQEAEGDIAKAIQSRAKDQASLQGLADALTRERTGLSGLGSKLKSVGWVPGLHVVGALGAGLEAVGRVTNPYVEGSALKALYEKLGVLESINEKVGDSIEAGARSIARGGELAKGARGAVEGAGTYQKHVKRLDQLADPETMMNHLSHTTGSLQQSAPNVTQGIQGAVGRAAQFLQSKIPRPQRELPMDGEWEASPSQKDKFNRYYAAVDSPLSVLKQVKSGSVSNEALEALQVVHPELLQEMRAKVMENLTPQAMARMPYSVKIAVNKFLGEPLTESMLPPVIIANQSIYSAMNQAKQAAAAGQQKSTQTGLAKLGLSKRAATETQSLEEEKA